MASVGNSAATALPASANRAGIILCGGQSKRMGLAKALLPLGEQNLLQHVVDLIVPHVQEVIVVAAAGQELPPLPSGVVIARDAQPGNGPLQGIVAGLSAVSPAISAALVTGCDLPLLSQQVIEFLFSQLDDKHLIAAVREDHWQPLPAVYRMEVLPTATQQLAAGQRKLADLLDRVTTRVITLEDLRTIDPELQSLQNINTPADYLALLERFGMDLPESLRQQLPDITTD